VDEQTNGFEFYPFNEIYLLIKYIKSVLWSEAKRLSYIEDALCLKVKVKTTNVVITFTLIFLAISEQLLLLNLRSCGSNAMHIY
jgi:hypothetical protein